MEHTLEEIRRMYDCLDRVCGVDTSTIRLKFTPRCSNRLGVCKIRNFLPVEIVISEITFADDDVYRDVVLHEYCHALVALRTGAIHHHDAVWKAACREVGCRPNAKQDLNAHIETTMANRSKYSVRCLQCGEVTNYARMSNVVSAMLNYQYLVCGNCGSRDFSLSADGIEVLPPNTDAERRRRIVEQSA